MKICTFTIRLTSDAEPGTGLGGEVINQLVPRDHWGRPVIRASHVKGLMRQQLRELIRDLGWDATLDKWVFGGEKLNEDAAGVGAAATFQVADAVAEPGAQGHSATGLVTRTQVDDKTGVASDATLRTTERVASGTVFRGAVHSDQPVDSVADLAWRLALLSIPAVGGSRNRGCGDCIVTLDDEARSPGELLAALHGALQKADWKHPLAEPLRRGPLFRTDRDSTPDAVVLRLVFQASTPICCPEHPSKANVISTGFSIPASAVQGAILCRLNELAPTLATDTFNDLAFRAWPLHPCRLLEPASDDGPSHDNQDIRGLRDRLAELSEGLPASIRVSLTHRVAKFSVGVPGDELLARHFFDEAIDEEPEDWTEIADGAPLKASDGVLLVRADQVELWRASSMPHVLTSHGVHGASPGERNLFTMDAIAPLIWEGLAVMPRVAAEQLLDSLQDNPRIALGKSRSVRGMGVLYASKLEETPTAWRVNSRSRHPVLVVQSPVQLPDSMRPGASAEDEFLSLVRAWSREHGLPEPGRAWPNPGLRFGWNRHDRGHQQAGRVILPGSVVAFDTDVEPKTLAAALRAGMGPGRERGYGAVSVHPGKATSLAKPNVRVPRSGIRSGAKQACECVLKIRHSGQRLPSPSQIRAVQQRLLDSGSAAALQYLSERKDHATRIWFAWESIYDDLEGLLRDHSQQVAHDALELLADLAIYDSKEQRR
ncbi:MAG: hypothetical protein J5I93_02690 [Pirellulaceae bacterium]|nr:hypothetical protein [Pirellulaceae bacterium]